MQRNKTDKALFSELSGYWLKKNIVQRLRALTDEAFWEFYLNLNKAQRIQFISWLVDGQYPLDGLSARVTAMLVRLTDIASQGAQKVSQIEAEVFQHGVLLLLELHEEYREYLYREWLQVLDDDQVSNPVVNYLEQTCANELFFTAFKDQFPAVVECFYLCHLANVELISDENIIAWLLAGGANRLLQLDILRLVAENVNREEVSHCVSRKQKLISALQCLFFTAENKAVVTVLAQNPLLARQLYSSDPCRAKDEALRANIFDENYLKLSRLFNSFGEFLQQQAELLKDEDFARMSSKTLLLKPRQAQFMIEQKQLIRLLNCARSNQAVLAAIAFDLNSDAMTNLSRRVRRYYRDTLGVGLEKLAEDFPIFYPVIHKKDPIQFLLSVDLNSSTANLAKEMIGNLLASQAGMTLFSYEIKQFIAGIGEEKLKVVDLRGVQTLLRQVRSDEFRAYLLNAYISEYFANGKIGVGKFQEMAQALYMPGNHRAFSVLISMMTPANIEHCKLHLIRSRLAGLETGGFDLVWLALKYPESHEMLRQVDAFSELDCKNDFIAPFISSIDWEPLIKFMSHFPNLVSLYQVEINNRLDVLIGGLTLKLFTNMLLEAEILPPSVEEKLQHRFVELVNNADQAEHRVLSPTVVMRMFKSTDSALSSKFAEMCEKHPALVHHLLQDPHCDNQFIYEKRDIFANWCRTHQLYVAENVSIDDLIKLRAAGVTQINQWLVRSIHIVMKLSEDFKTHPLTLEEMNTILDVILFEHSQPSLVDPEISKWLSLLRYVNSCDLSNVASCQPIVKLIDKGFDSAFSVLNTSRKEAADCLRQSALSRGSRAFLSEELTDFEVGADHTTDSVLLERYSQQIGKDGALGYKAALIVAKQKEMNIAIWIKKKNDFVLVGIQQSMMAGDARHLLWSGADGCEYQLLLPDLNMQKIYQQAMLLDKLLRLAFVIPRTQEIILGMKCLEQLPPCISQNLAQLICASDLSVRENVFAVLPYLKELYEVEIKALTTTPVKMLPLTPNKLSTVSRLGMYSHTDKPKAARRLEFPEPPLSSVKPH